MRSIHLATFFTMVMVWEANSNENLSLLDDLLQPYKVQHGSSRSNRHVRDIQSPRYNYTYEIFTANTSDTLTPTSSTRYFVSDVARFEYMTYSPIVAYGHITTVTNPLLSLSVLEPREEGGCSNNFTETVAETARRRNCIVAQNGGFYNTTSGNCLGNIVSDGQMVQNAGGVQNANFGITKNGSIVVGYLSEEDLEQLQFQQLVGGAIWLVRNGESYVEDSFKCESSEIEETGTLRTFIDVQSARTAIGHDSNGRVVLVQVEGQTRARGVNLDQFARLLIKEFHVVNAINLDGGGSATLVLNGTLSNYPSDHCKNDPEWRCARAVSTVICVHEPDCVPKCVNGECVNGRCLCELNYSGESCDELYCAKHNCSQHGVCHPVGCDCTLGWQGPDCTIPCSPGWYGKNCSQECLCRNNGSCDAVSGVCDCLPGFGGALCEKGCELGSYGKNCEFRCHCDDTCFCDSASGICGNFSTNLFTFEHYEKDPVIQVAQCVAKKIIRNQTENLPSQENEEFQWVSSLSAIIAILALSVLFNIYLMLLKSDCWEHIYPGIGSEVADDYIPLRSMERDRKRTKPQKTKLFSVKSKKRTKFKSRLPSWGGLMTKFKNSNRSREGYTRLVLPESNIEFEETSLLSQFG